MNLWLCGVGYGVLCLLIGYWLGRQSQGNAEPFIAISLDNNSRHFYRERDAD